MLGVLTAAIFTAITKPDANTLALMDESLAYLEAGLPLAAVHRTSGIDVQRTHAMWGQALSLQPAFSRLKTPPKSRRQPERP